MNGRKIQAILFDLGETLILFGRLRAGEIFNRASRLSYDYLVEQNQPVGSYGLYWLWNNFSSIDSPKSGRIQTLTLEVPLNREQARDLRAVHGLNILPILTSWGKTLFRRVVSIQ